MLRRGRLIISTCDSAPADSWSAWWEGVRAGSVEDKWNHKPVKFRRFMVIRPHLYKGKLESSSQHSVHKVYMKII